MSKKVEYNFIEMGAMYGAEIANCSDASIEFQVNEKMRMLVASFNIKAAVDFREGAYAAVNYVRQKATTKNAQAVRVK